MKVENGKWEKGRWLALICLVIALHSPLSVSNSPFSTLHSLQAQEIRQADRKTYAEALAHYNSRNFKQSAVLLRKVAARNPKAAEPQFWLGMASVNDGFNTAGIRRYFTKCIALDPDYPHPLAHYYMGVIYYTDADYDAATAELKRYFSLAEGSDNREVNAAYEEASNYLYWSQFLAEAMLNQAPFDPICVAGVSSKNDEALPYLSPDGREFYYLRRLPLKHERSSFYVRELEEKVWRLCMSKLTDTIYSKGFELPAPFNSGNPEGSVSLTADGRELYYSIIKDEQGYLNSDLYKVRRTDGRWGTPEQLGRQVNSPDSWESQPTVSADGQILIFASNRKGGRGGTDLWRCRRLNNGDWSRPENLGDKINTEGNEKMPFLAADGHTLYFASDGWQGFGGYDIYFADLSDPHGNRPTNLGLPINTEADEGGFGVTTDGRRAYFAGRTDNSRSMDILMFDLYPAARPEAMTLRHIAVDGRDTTLVLCDKGLVTVTLASQGKLPAIFHCRANQLPAKVMLSDSVAACPLTSPEAVGALADWLIANPRVHLVVECPKSADARQAYDLLKARGIRAERLSQRSGTEIRQHQIRLK